MFEEELDSGKYPEKAIMNRMHLSVLRIEQAINKLTNIAKIQRNPYDDINVLFINDVINEVIDEYWKHFFNSNKEEASIKTDLKVPLIEYSETGLESIIYKLVSNAIKYASSE